jgi:hypothetical protein
MINKSINIVRKRRPLFILIFVVTLILSTSIVLSGCGGGGGGSSSSGGGQVTINYNISTSPSQITLTGADSSFLNISSTDPLDTGFSVISSSPNIEVSNNGLTNNVFSVASNGTPGNYTITVTGTNSNVSVTVPVTVNSPAYPNTLPINFLPNDKPFVTILIDGEPFNLVFDTGSTGIVIDQSALQAAGVAINTNNSNPCTVKYGIGSASGYPGTANIQMGNLIVDNVPLIVATSAPDTGFNYPSDFFQGDIGMGLSPYSSDGNQCSNGVFTPSPLPSGYNQGFTLSMPNLSFSSNGTDIDTTGLLTLGLNTTEQNNDIPANNYFFQNNSSVNTVPIIDSEFGGINSYINSSGNAVSFLSVFDTGSSSMFWGSNALNNASGDINLTEYSCSSTLLGSDFVDGGYYMNLEFEDSSSNYINANFETYPINPDMCNLNFFGYNALSVFLVENDISVRNNPQPGLEIMGMPFILNLLQNNNTLYWQQHPWGVGIF